MDDLKSRAPLWKMNHLFQARVAGLNTIQLASLYGIRGSLDMDEKTRTEIEAATFRRLVDHFRTHSEV